MNFTIHNHFGIIDFQGIIVPGVDSVSSPFACRQTICCQLSAGDCDVSVSHIDSVCSLCGNLGAGNGNVTVICIDAASGIIEAIPLIRRNRLGNNGTVSNRNNPCIPFVTAIQPPTRFRCRGHSTPFDINSCAGDSVSEPKLHPIDPIMQTSLRLYGTVSDIQLTEKLIGQFVIVQSLNSVCGNFRIRNRQVPIYCDAVSVALDVNLSADGHRQIIRLYTGTELLPVHWNCFRLCDYIFLPFTYNVEGVEPIVGLREIGVDASLNRRIGECQRICRRIKGNLTVSQDIARIRRCHLRPTDPQRKLPLIAVCCRSCRNVQSENGKQYQEPRQKP